MKEKELTVPGGCVKLYFDPGIIEVRINRTVEHLDWGTENRLGRVRDDIDITKRFERNDYGSKAEWQNAVVKYVIDNGEVSSASVIKMIYGNTVDFREIY